MTTTVGFAVNQKNPFTATLTFADINGVPFVPTAVQWKLWDDTNKIEMQAYTALTGLSSSMSFEVPGSLNILNNPGENLTEKHMILVQTTIPGGDVREDNVYFDVIFVPDA